MLKYRDIDYQKDVSEIIQLLRTSLSENHTEEAFLWKHFHNPFGKSYGRLACDKGKIVGVRMFMFWEFRNGQEIIKAIRPVDTITHPDYRGQGIFKKLTLEGLKECTGNYDLVFNTPNENSLPGYIKMGWERYRNDLNFFVAPVIPFTLETISCKRIPVKEIFIKERNFEIEAYHTNRSTEFIHWRYENESYRAAKVEVRGRTLFIIYKIIKIKGINTLVINEIIGDKKFHSPAVKGLMLELKIYIIYYLKNALLGLDFIISQKRQNSVVVYKEDSKNIISDLLFSAGDLEGRL